MPPCAHLELIVASFLSPVSQFGPAVTSSPLSWNTLVNFGFFILRPNKGFKAGQLAVQNRGSDSLAGCWGQTEQGRRRVEGRL